MWVFPDDRPSLDELRDTEAELNRVLPSACYFAAKTAFVPATLYAKTIMERLGASCGMDANTTFATFPSFDSIDAFKKMYDKNPESYYACLHFEAENKDSFSIYYNESLTSGRYLPNMDAKTMAWKNHH